MGETNMNSLQKFYIGLWSAFGIIVAALAITGSLTMMAFTVLGFVCFGLIFMGMMCVLPTTVGNHAVHAAAPKVVRSRRVTVRRFINAWTDPIGVELRQPKTR